MLTLIFLFRSSSGLASAYGIAVCGTMLTTTVLAFVYLRDGLRWPFWLAVALVAPIAVIETGFFAANALKLPDGGYVPILLAVLMAVAIATWTKGTALLFQRARRTVVPLETFVRSAESERIATVSGTAVYLTSDPAFAPPALLHNPKHNKVLHEQIVILTVVNLDTPRLVDGERITIERLDDRFLRIAVRFGFMEDPNLSQALALCRREGLKFEVMSTSFFLSRRKLVAEGRYGMPVWQDRIYIGLASIATGPSDFYRLPRERVVELGSQMAI